MYKQVETAKEIILENGGVVNPVATLKSDLSEGECQIVEDDGCYLILLNTGKNLTYRKTYWIFPEVLEVLKTLPDPRIVE